MTRLIFLAAVCALGTASAQDPFEVAADHYKMVFENEWVRVVRVVYEPFGKAPKHDHPNRPTVFIYTTDGGPIRFVHSYGIVNVRPAVKAGAIRFSRGMIEEHSVESLSAIPSEYLRIELKTEPLDLPGDIRLDPPPREAGASAEKVQFENRQLRIVRVICAPHAACLAFARTEDPAVLVSLSDTADQRWKRGEARWLAPSESRDYNNAGDKPLELVCLELKSRPVPGG
jgi:hypothetical protein